MFFQLAYHERLSLYLIEAGHDEPRNFTAELCGELSVVLLAYDDFFVAFQYFGGICGQRVDIVEMSQRYFLSFAIQFVDCREKMPVCSAPAYDE